MAIFQLASRAAAREREAEMQKGVAREAGASSPTHNASRRASTAGAGRAPTQGGRRASMKWEAPDGAMGPTQFIELAECVAGCCNPRARVSPHPCNGGDECVFVFVAAQVPGHHHAVRAERTRVPLAELRG